MYFLAIETSCDETAAAVFTDEPAILANVVASQTDLHARFGGVVPEVAARAHLQRLLPVIDEALPQGRRPPRPDRLRRRPQHAGPGRGAAGRRQRRQDAGAGPGRAADRASTTSRPTSTPAGWRPGATSFPASAWSSAAGTRRCSTAATPLRVRAARRHARRRGRRGVRQGGEPARPRLSRRPGRRARGGRRQSRRVRFPRSFLHEDRLDFSFSGLKTAVLYTCFGQNAASPAAAARPDQCADLAASFQQAVDRRAGGQGAAGAAADGAEAAGGRRRRGGQPATARRPWKAWPPRKGRSCSFRRWSCAPTTRRWRPQAVEKWRRQTVGAARPRCAARIEPPRA